MGWKFAERLKALRTIPRISPASQIGVADWAILLLFLVGGVAGFPGFAKYADIKTLIASLDHKQAWAIFLFIFNFLLIYRKIRKSYFVAWLALIHAFIADAVIAGICILAAKLTILNALGLLNTVVGVQAGLAAVYLIVQGWIDFAPDVRSLATTFNEVEKSADRIQALGRGNVEPRDVKQLRDLCGKFVLDVDAALLTIRHDDSVRAALAPKRDTIEAISQALGAPTEDIPEALERARNRPAAG